MRMMHRLLLGMVLWGGAGISREVAAQCTGETETGRRLVLEYATRYTNARPAGVPVVTADRVRALTDPADGAVCQQLFYVFWGQWNNPEEAKPGWHWTYYQVGDLYYVVAHRLAPPVSRNADGTFNITLGWTPIFVIDRSYTLIASVAR